MCLLLGVCPYKVGLLVFPVIFNGTITGVYVAGFEVLKFEPTDEIYEGGLD